MKTPDKDPAVRRIRDEILRDRARLNQCIEQAELAELLEQPVTDAAYTGRLYRIFSLMREG
jgi:hypothetical protein